MVRELLPPMLRQGGVEEVKKNRSHHRRPKKQEQSVAEAVGGRRQPGSGAMAHSKGDVIRNSETFPLLIECKRTHGQKTLRVESDWLAKITREAHAKGKYPALSIEFDDEIMKQLSGSPESTWVALPLTVFKALLEKAEAEE